MGLQKWIKQTDSESGYVSIDKYCSKVRMFKQSYEIETVLFLNLQSKSMDWFLYDKII